MTPQDFVQKFPKSKLNIENLIIYNLLKKFIEKYFDKFDKTWQTVNFYLKKFFKENGKELLGHNDRQVIFWTSRGWSENKAIKKIIELSRKSSLSCVEYYLMKGYTEKESKKLAKEFYKKNFLEKRLLPIQKQYWINKGYSEVEAIKKIREEQRRRANKLKEKENKNPQLRKERMWINVEYYLKRGYNEKQAEQIIAEKFKKRNLQTFKKLVEKLINKGYTEEESIEKARKHYKERARKSMETRKKNNSFGFQKASKQSIKFFKPLMDYLDENKIEYYVGCCGKSEYFIAKGKDYFLSYDFTIPKFNLIIEYNGEHVHPNPKMSEIEWKNWKHKWTGESADEVRKRDLKKIEIAKENGFEVIEVFESDKVNSLKKFKDFFE
jgi:hypothetical protein